MTLANWCISNKTNGLISKQQISRHIQELQNHNLINVEISGGRRRAISCNGIDYNDPKPSFTPIIGLAETTLTPSETITLSMLANYACIYARSNIGFSLPEPTVVGVGKKLADTKALSTTSYNRALEGLMAKGLIYSDKSNGPNTGYHLDAYFCGRYQALLRVNHSERAEYLVTARAMSSVVNYVDNPLTRRLKAHRANVVPADLEPVADVLSTPDGLLIIKEDGIYMDTNGYTHPCNEQLPYYESSLEQHVVPRCNEPYPVYAQEPSLEEALQGVSRREFYELNKLNQWVITINEATGNQELAHEAEIPYKFTAEQLKQVAIYGIAGASESKPRVVTNISSYCRAQQTSMATVDSRKQHQAKIAMTQAALAFREEVAKNPLGTILKYVQADKEPLEPFEVADVPAALSAADTASTAIATSNGTSDSSDSTANSSSDLSSLLCSLTTTDPSFGSGTADVADVPAASSAADTASTAIATSNGTSGSSDSTTNSSSDLSSLSTTDPSFGSGGADVSDVPAASSAAGTANTSNSTNSALALPHNTHDVKSFYGDSSKPQKQLAASPKTQIAGTKTPMTSPKTPLFAPKKGGNTNGQINGQSNELTNERQPTRLTGLAVASDRSGCKRTGSSAYTLLEPASGEKATAQVDPQVLINDRINSLFEVLMPDELKQKANAKAQAFIDHLAPEAKAQAVSLMTAVEPTRKLKALHEYLNSPEYAVKKRANRIDSLACDIVTAQYLGDGQGFSIAQKEAIVAGVHGQANSAFAKLESLKLSAEEQTLFEESKRRWWHVVELVNQEASGHRNEAEVAKLNKGQMQFYNLWLSWHGFKYRF